jgi:hypothetical protein
MMRLKDEAMAPRIWFLTIDAPFLLKMRGGCGAHVIAKVSNTVAAATKVEGVMKEQT